METNHELKREMEKCYYSQKRTNYRTFTHSDTLYLMSYCSLVASYNNTTKTLTLYPRYDYSPTTQRHVNQFIEKETGMRIYSSQRRHALKLGKWFDVNVKYCETSLVIGR